MSSIKLVAKVVVAVGALSILLFPTVAHAETLVQDFSFGPALTAWSTSFAFNQFDPTVGFLQSVQFDVEGTINVDYSITNNGPTGIFTPAGTATLTLDPIPGLSGGIMHVVPVTSQNVTLGPGQSITSSTSSTKTGTTTITSPLTGYIGNGTLNFNLNATSQAGVNGSGNFTSSFSQTTGAKVKLTYIYNTPEPGTFALALPVAFGLLPLVRRKKA